MAAHQYGKLAPKPEDTHPRVKLARYLAVTPAVPIVVDWASAVTDWPVYKNTTVGDCTCAALGHMVEAWTTYGEGSTVTLTDDDVLRLYEKITGYDPATGANDNGALEQDVLSYVQNYGIGGHKIRAFAQFNHADLVEMKQALDIFGGVYVGFQVPRSAEQQFSAGTPWTVSGDNTILGGHAVNIQKWDAEFIYAVTWGKLQAMSPEFWTTYGDEAWVIITDDWINKTSGVSPTGLDLKGLLDEFDALTGQPANVTPPQPGGCNPLGRLLRKFRKA